MTLACEDGNSKLVEVVTVVEVDDEKRVDNSLVQIWKVNFGHKVKFLFGLWGQGFKVCSRFWSWCSGKILKLYRRCDLGLLYFCHHHHFVFSTLVAGGNECHVCREPQSVCHPNLYLHSPFDLSYAGTSNIKCLMPMFNAQCSMFNVQCSMFNIQCSMFNVQYSMFNVQCFNIRCVTHVGGV